MNITIADGEYFLRRTQKLHDLGLTEMEFELRDHFKIKSSDLIEELLSDWNNCVTGNEYMLKQIASWKIKYDLRIALLSNLGLEHAKMMPYILAQGDFYKSSVKHFSCEVGARKPSLIYYQSFLQQFPEFYHSVYVDDLAENLEASKKFCFQTFQFSLENANINSELDKLEELIKG
jgi:FMN phosphatase YigB (HAD superfamily)